ncbi:MAG: hypothetical protein CMJ78_24785 [Planctomycetaceae bacterium]|nr:hypothetical protein [Planctomycetaceae bacterium]
MVYLLALSIPAFAQNPKFAPVRTDIPMGGSLSPRQEEPVFAVCSKQGMRILVSRDDGKTWKQTFLATDSREDGGWHGNYAVYGMAYTEGVIGVFSGWGTPGIYIGSDDGETWSHLNKEPAKLGSAWGATGGKGIMLTAADQWRGITSSSVTHANWKKHSLRELLNGGKTHHIICGFGDYKGGRFLAIGDNRQVFFSQDLCKTWKHGRIPEGVGDRGQQAIAFGNNIFVCSFQEKVARSLDGGMTWTLHDHGLKGSAAWRGLSFVNGEFWLTGRRSGGRRSKDGATWNALPSGTPTGRFVQSPNGTIINVARFRYDIKRSTDGKSWETVFTAPGGKAKAKDVTWDTAFAVYGKVNKAAK